MSGPFGPGTGDTWRFGIIGGMTNTPAEPVMPPLAALPEDWDRALAVVAHPDDMEYGAASAVARWTGQGKQVRYLLATRGEAGIDGVPPDQAARVRTAEQIASCAAVGVPEPEFLDHPDGMISDAMLLRRQITSAIRRHRPDVVITVNHRETFGPGALNMADHRVVGQAAIDAVRDAANRWVFPDLAGPDGDPLPPWPGVRMTAISASPSPTHAVDVGDHLAAGIASLRCHVAYLEGLGDSWPAPEVFLPEWAARTGERFGGRPAVAFEVFGG